MHPLGQGAPAHRGGEQSIAVAPHHSAWGYLLYGSEELKQGTHHGEENRKDHRIMVFIVTGAQGKLQDMRKSPDWRGEEAASQHPVCRNTIQRQIPIL